MPDDPNIEFLHGVYAAWAQGDYSRDVLHSDVEFVTFTPERRSYRGREGAGHAWGDFLSAWEGFATSAEEVVPVGDGRYLVLVRRRGRGKGSQVQMEAAAANVVTVRDGLITRLELIRERGEAFRSVGLPTPP